jgi:putative transcriptional regulator
MSKAGERILKSAQQALAFAEGQVDVANYRVHTFSPLDIKAIREKTGLSQAMFAKTFALHKRTLEEWEQGRRAPKGPAMVLLTIIDRAPQAVMSALAQQAAPNSKAA